MIMYHIFIIAFIIALLSEQLFLKMLITFLVSKFIVTLIIARHSWCRDGTVTAIKDLQCSGGDKHLNR